MLFVVIIYVNYVNSFFITRCYLVNVAIHFIIQRMSIIEIFQYT